MKITLVCTNYFPAVGGAETYFYELSNNLALKGHDVTVFTSNFSGQNGQQLINKVKVNYMKWPSLFGHPLPFSLYKTENRKVLNKSDVIHTSTMSLPLGIIPYIFRKNSKVIITVFEYIGSRWFSVEKSKIIALIYYLFELFIIGFPYRTILTISNASRDDIAKHPLVKPEKIEVVYPGIDDVFHVKRKGLTKSKCKYFLFYGRPGKTKGVINLIEAVRLAVNELKYHNLKLIMILGKEPKLERKYILGLIKKYDLADIVEVKKSISRDELILNIQNASFVVIPSLTEGFGFTTVESCTLGKPVVISDAGSLPEVVFGKYIITEKGNVKSLSEGILSAIKNDFSTKAKMTFDWDETTNKVLKSYTLLMNNKK